MKQRKLSPFSPESVDLIVENLNKMTPKELYDYITYRTPGVPLTDITGRFGLYDEKPSLPDTPEVSKAA